MACIRSIAHYVPEQVITNHDLTKLMETSDEWIRQRSGIAQRNWVRQIKSSESVPESAHANAELAHRATKLALQRAEIEADQLEAIFYASVSPDNEFHGSSADLKRLLVGGDARLATYEIRNQCSGFLFALSLAKTCVNSGQYKTVLVVGSEIHSTGLDLSTRGRDFSVLFGDGAGAAVVSASDQEQIISVLLESDGSYADRLRCNTPGFAACNSISEHDFVGEKPSIYAHMEGNLVFRMASLKMPEMVQRLLQQNSISIEQIKLIIPHQANQRIIDMLGQSLGCPDKVFSNIQNHGNTTAASIPIAFSEAYAKGLIKKGDLLALTSFGAGFSWASALIRW